MLEEDDIIVWVEERLIPFQLWTVSLETYFVEYAKNYEHQSFAAVNQS